MTTPSDQDTAHETRVVGRILLGVLVALAAWGGSIAIWGVPGLYIPALIMVPLLVGLLIWISRG